MRRWIEVGEQNQEDGDSYMPSNWDYYEGDGEYQDTNWNERDDPCKASYYRYAPNIRAARNLLASNIGLIAKRAAKGKLLAVATALDSAKPFANVKINVINDPNYYGDQYLKLAFSVDFWGTRAYLNQVQQGSLPNAPFNETHWPPKSGTGSNFESLYNQALAETDVAKRIQIQHEMQQIEYNIGGYIIPFFGGLIDGYSTKVKGLVPSKGTLNLDSFGHGYRTIWFG